MQLQSSLQPVQPLSLPTVNSYNQFTPSMSSSMDTIYPAEVECFRIFGERGRHGLELCWNQEAGDSRRCSSGIPTGSLVCRPMHIGFQQGHTQHPFLFRSLTSVTKPMCICLQSEEPVQILDNHHGYSFLVPSQLCVHVGIALQK
ncbi:unnamed protein product, partial [Nesidiocoris tenuis]